MSRQPIALDRMVTWFIPRTALRGRTDWEMARTFAITHVFGPLLALPMSLLLFLASPGVDLPLLTVTLAICAFWALPFLLRWSGSITLVAVASFQLLTATALYGAWHWGGFSSPFLPWLVVGLMVGLFFLRRSAVLVIALFVADGALFLVLLLDADLPAGVSLEELRVLGWFSILLATLYTSWMALRYGRIVGLRTELETEIDRQHATAFELEKARARAEETSLARARFFAKMNHELRTPLNAIIGYSDILLEDCADDTSSRRASDIARINAAGRHLLSLVSDVLDPTRIGRDVLEIKPTCFTLGALVDEVVATATPIIERNGNAFVVRGGPRRRPLRTDARKVRQILLNLLGNAGKFTRNGTVRLDFRVERASGEDQLVLCVSDTGIGIAPGALPRLFTDYEQGDPTVFNRYGGTGIGLALSRKLCILLGGEIRVTSRVGQGTRFVVRMPAHLPDIEEPVARTSRGLWSTAPEQVVVPT